MIQFDFMSVTLSTCTQLNNEAISSAIDFLLKNIIHQEYSFIYLDINECLLGMNGCMQLCNNTVGSYKCSCNTGYTLAADNSSCHGRWNICSAQLYLLHSMIGYRLMCASII